MSQPAGAFSVDLERAQDSIRELEQAKEQLQALQKEAFALGRVVPPAQDQVSRDAAQALSAVAVGGPRSLLSALDAGVERLQTLIDDLRADLVSYRAADDDGRRALSRDGRA